MTEHLGGPRNVPKSSPSDTRSTFGAATRGKAQCSSSLSGTGSGSWSIGYWEREWRGQQLFGDRVECTSEFQGKGIATRAARLIVKKAKAELHEGYLHAFPSVANGPSNGVCPEDRIQTSRPG